MPSDDLRLDLGSHGEPPPAAAGSGESLFPETAGDFSPTEGDVAGGLVIESQRTRHTGPIPSPQALAAYEHVLPGSADRILKMAEGQSSHRQNHEANMLAVAKEKMRWDAGSELLGVASGLVVAMSLIGGSVWLAATGHPIVGGIASSATVVSLTAVFIYGRRTGIPKHLIPTVADDRRGLATAGQPTTAGEVPG